MNELNKLIQQYETENPGKKAKPQYMTSYDAEFAEWLASRPTCGVEQRKFLDEIREKFVIGNKTLLSRQPMVDGEYVILFQSDFKCNLQELVEGKG